jgi:hypothetical protein
MQINLPESGTIFFISDHCHVIENVSQPDARSSKKHHKQRKRRKTNTSPPSGATASLKVGWREITLPGKSQIQESKIYI